MEVNLKVILKKFETEVSGNDDIVFVPISSGHINSTYSVIVNGVKKYILQRVNTSIFTNPDNLMSNITLVTSHIMAKGLTTLEFLPAKTGKSYADINGEIWRLSRFLENSANLDDFAVTNETLEKAGQALADFELSLIDFDASKLFELIPNFHNTKSRMEDFEKAVENNFSGRVGSALSDIQFVRDNKFLSVLIVNGLESGSIPLRVTHNDTKLSNILVDQKSKEVLCLIDLDTIMPGSILYDFGDALRLAASSAAEDEANLSVVHFVPEKFESFCRGYLSVAKDFISKPELSLLPESVAILTFECGSRFLADYLNGDTYFKTAYPEHNLIRARNQFKLVKEILDNLPSLHKTIEKIMIGL